MKGEGESAERSSLGQGKSRDKSGLEGAEVSEMATDCWQLVIS